MLFGSSPNLISGVNVASGDSETDLDDLQDLHSAMVALERRLARLETGEERPT